MKLKDKLFLGFLAAIAITSGWAGLWALTALFGGIVLAILGGQFYFNRQKNDNVVSKGKTLAFQNKYDRVNIKKYSLQFLSIGMLIATATTLLAFNWSTSPPERIVFTTGTISAPVTLPPITERTPPPPPPPPVVAPPEIEVVENEDIVDEAPTNLFTEEKGENQVVNDVFADLAGLIDLGLDTPIETEPEPDTYIPVVDFADKMPEFPGGIDKMMQFIYSNMNYPAIARENGIEGLCVVSFIVMEDGSIQDIVMRRDIGGGCKEEVIRIVESMPTWIPGEQNFKKVRVRFNLPIKFMLK